MNEQHQHETTLVGTWPPCRESLDEAVALKWVHGWELITAFGVEGVGVYMVFKRRGFR